MNKKLFAEYLDAIYTVQKDYQKNYRQLRDYRNALEIILGMWPSEDLEIDTDSLKIKGNLMTVDPTADLYLIAINYLKGELKK
jgi:outer membrane protein TolC